MSAAFRRRLFGPAAALALACALFFASGALAQAPAVAALGITVSDADRATAFYTGVLGFEKIADVEVAGEDVERLQAVFGARLRVVTLRLGRELVELNEYLAPQGRPFPEDTRANDLWFQHAAIVVADIDRAYQVLRKHGVRHASTGPQTLPAWNVNAAGIRAFYFRDPDGHFLELIQFPAGKGDPRWQDAGGRLFLGIDHTAIVVRDTEESLRFWRDRVGLTVAGGSENYGPEQERLNNVFGARLRITTLRGASGPGVELLEYLAPRDGRPRPKDARANDLLHWHTRLSVASAQGAAEALRTPPAGWISPGVVELRSRELGLARGLLAADPDGHVLLLSEVSR